MRHSGEEGWPAAVGDPTAVGDSGLDNRRGSETGSAAGREPGGDAPQPLTWRADEAIVQPFDDDVERLLAALPC